VIIGVEPVAEAVVELGEGEGLLEEGEELGTEGFEETFDFAASLGGIGG